ncbi:MAG: PHP domain-containing protein [Betaproteobacteria bacterium]|nr:PHP domain-containing protein [Betaproteobacteria bacterium]
MIIDLHCHSTASDGALAPAEVVRRAALHGVEVLALTDHDDLSGLAAARVAAEAANIAFIDGVEISVTWRGATVHVLGLRIDPANAGLVAGLESVRSGRVQRARAMSQELAAAGIEDVFEGAIRHAGNPAMIGRTHFARYLAQIGVVSEPREAFKRYLVPGKPGYVPHRWAGLEDVVNWIVSAGGTAVIAHPGRYALSAEAMKELVGEFREAGGEAIESVSSSHSRGQYREFGELAAHFGIGVSAGSDFHGPGEGAELGSLPAPEAGARVVWADWPRCDG